MKVKKSSVKKSYSKWDQIYYQITPEGKKKSGILKRFFAFMSYDQLEVLNYLARHKTPRSLKGIYEGISWQVTRAGVLKAVTALKRKGYIERIKR